MTPRPSRRAISVAIVIAAVYLVPLGVTGTAVALPDVAADLGSDAGGLQWVVNAFNVSFAVFTIVAGMLTDRIGARSIFGLGLGVLVTASAFSAFSASLLHLDLARLLAGAGGGGIVASGSALLTRLHPPGPARRRAFALFGSTIGLGLALGPTICGGVVAAFGWRGVYVIVALAAAVLLGLHRLLPPGRALPPDLEPSAQPTTGILSNRRLVALIVVPLAPAAGFVTMVSYLPTALSAVFGMNAAEIGVFLLPMTLPVLLGPLLAARLIVRRRRVTPGLVVYASLGAILLGDVGLLLLSPHISPMWLLAPLFLIGLGYGLPLGVIDGEAVAAVTEERTGTAAGILNAVRTGGAAIAVALYGYAMVLLLSFKLPGASAIRAASGETGYAQAYAGAFHIMVIAMALVVAAVWVIFFWLERRAPPPPGNALVEATQG